jgi:styrene-oxide isomerase
MSELEGWEVNQLKRLQGSIIAHGALMLFVGLVAGVMLTFAMLQGVKIWPILDIPMDIPGSILGWKAAHVGGMMNGIMLMVVALCLSKVILSAASSRFMFYALVLTGWGNTIFYWFGNFSMNKGLSVGATPYGEGDLYGAIAFISAGSVMILTFIASLMLVRAGFKIARQN